MFIQLSFLDSTSTTRLFSSYDYLGDCTIAFHSVALLVLTAAALILAITDQPVVKGSSRLEASLSPARL
jgi:hypothetical protein